MQRLWLNHNPSIKSYNEDFLVASIANTLSHAINLQSIRSHFRKWNQINSDEDVSLKVTTTLKYLLLLLWHDINHRHYQMIFTRFTRSSQGFSMTIRFFFFLFLLMWFKGRKKEEECIFSVLSVLVEEENRRGMEM